ncbi:MAG: ABC transporter permease [Bacteroidetes bacterium]|nr:MAG: ABC transporter permease [Bacteroidota bacterium]
MLFRKTTYVSSSSLSALAWKKFRKDKLGFGSLTFIGIVFLIALLGYLITPDPTPFANDQCLEMGLKKPGYTATFILVPKEPPVKRTNLFHRMIWGQQSRSQAYPIVDGTVDIYDKEGVYLREVPDAFLAQHPEARQVARTYRLGTDRFGRDILSMLVIGARISLSVGFISVFISLVLGILIGSIGGYFRGWMDHVIVWFINVVWSIPTLLLVIAITFALGKGFWQVFIAVGLTMWVEVARVVRGQILSLREKEFVEAGRALGFSSFRIITRHLLPNVMGVVVVISAANFASAILIEAGLSFLGMGVQPPVPSWGSMIKENYGYIVLDYAYLAILPGIAIMLLVLAFMLIGNALRDALDVKTL